jgi:prepilin signal peptidase PulO-like enzyme (type II secretory pathway)
MCEEPEKLLGGGFAALVLVLTASIISLQTGALPQWLAWLGIVAAVVLVFAVIFLPMIALLIWVLAVSIVMLMRRDETPAVAA